MFWIRILVSFRFVNDHPAACVHALAKVILTQEELETGFLPIQSRFSTPCFTGEPDGTGFSIPLFISVVANMDIQPKIHRQTCISAGGTGRGFQGSTDLSVKSKQRKHYLGSPIFWGNEGLCLLPKLDWLSVDLLWMLPASNTISQPKYQRSNWHASYKRWMLVFECLIVLIQNCNGSEPLQCENLDLWIAVTGGLFYFCHHLQADILMSLVVLNYCLRYSILWQKLQDRVTLKANRALFPLWLVFV